MKDLTVEIKAVFAAGDVAAKKQAMRTLIEASHAKEEVKRKAYTDVERMKNTSKIDQFAFNYMASGEGMKVR